VELITLFADHPSLIASTEADKAFWLLTDARLRDIYTAARAGQSVLELAHVQLPPPTARQVLSGKYSGAKDPVATLAAMTRDLELRRTLRDQADLRKKLVDEQRRGDRDAARQLARIAEAEAKGDRELAARLASEISSNRKQAD
jgi:hypothetical protein